MSQTPTLINNRDHGYVSIAPRFEQDDFSAWKDRMLLHIVGIEPYLMTILSKGPYVPKAVTFTPGATPEDEGTTTEMNKPEA